MTLTPANDGEEQEEEILTLDSGEEEVAQKPLEMWAKELLLKEQSEEYDSEEDPEYVPPSIIYETDKEYDEVRLTLHYIALISNCLPLVFRWR